VDILLKGTTETSGADPGEDRLGIYAAPTEAFHGLTLPLSVSYVPAEGLLLEAREFCTQALRCEPHLLRLLWQPNDSFDIRTPLGDELLKIKSAFLSASRVAEAYSLAMTEEVKFIQDQTWAKEDLSAGADRLLQLGSEALNLYRIGQILFVPDDEDFIDDFRRHAMAGRMDRVQSYVDYVQSQFVKDAFGRETPLPQEPDIGMVEEWLRYVRNRYFMKP
jgi:hypothetical protein